MLAQQFNNPSRAVNFLKTVFGEKMKTIFVLSIAFVVCLARPDVSHITNNEYLPPEYTKPNSYEAPIYSSPSHYSPPSELTSQLQQIQSHFGPRIAQIESIRPSIHIASFSLRTTVPLQQLQSQTQQPQSLQIPTQQSYFTKEIKQTSPVVSGNSQNFIVPTTYDQRAVQQTYVAPSTGSSPGHQIYTGSPSSTSQNYLPPHSAQQYFAPQHQPTQSHNGEPAAIQQTYVPPSANQQPIQRQPMQQFYTSQIPVQQTNTPQTAVDQTYLPPSPVQQTDTQQSAQKIYILPSQNYAPATPVQQNYPTVKQQTHTPSEALQHTYLPPAEAPQTYAPSTSVPIQQANVFQQDMGIHQTEPQVPVQQTYLTPTSAPAQQPFIRQQVQQGANMQATEYQASTQQTYTPSASVPTHQLYVSQQPIVQQQIVQPNYANSNFGNAKTSNVILPIGNGQPTHAFQTSAQQMYDLSPANQESLIQHRSSPQQSYSPPASSQVHISPQQVYENKLSAQQTYTPNVSPQQYAQPIQASTQAQQSYSSTATFLPQASAGVSQSPQQTQAPLQNVKTTSYESRGESQANRAPVEQPAYSPSVLQSNQQFLPKETPQPTQEVHIAPAPASVQPEQVVAPVTGFYSSHGPVAVKQDNFAPAPQPIPSTSAPQRTQNYAPSTLVAHGHSPTQALTNLGSHRYSAPVAQSIQKAVQTSEFHTSTVPNNQQPSTPLVSAQSYKPTNKAPSDFHNMFALMPNQLSEINYKIPEAQEAPKSTHQNTAPQTINISTNQVTSKPRKSTKLLPLQSEQKTETNFTNFNAAQAASTTSTEYASNGGYIYRRN